MASYIPKIFFKDIIIDDKIPENEEDIIKESDDDNSDSCPSTPEVPLKKSYKDENQKLEDNEKKDEINVNGIDYDDLKKMSFSINNKFKQCSYCLKFFNSNMISLEYELDPVCFHCMFWINYNLDMRGNVDGIYGKTIVEYIIECKDHHNKSNCQKNTSGGGCFICDYLNELPIKNILDGDILFKDKFKEKTLNNESEEFCFQISI